MTEQREILLIPFPFSDQSGRKIRPVIVVSNNEFNKYSEDVIVVGATSNLIKNKYSINLSNSDLEFGNLLTPCLIKVDNLLRLDKELIIKRIGKINKEKLQNIRQVLDNLLS